MKTIYYTDKTTGTPADTLVAFGLAHLLNLLVEQANVWIEDVGNSYAVEADLPANWPVGVDFQALLPGLETTKKQSPIGYKVDYLAHQANNQAYFAGREKDLPDEELRQQGITSPHPDWPVWAIINQVSAVDAYHKLLVLWQAHRNCFPDLLGIVDSLYRQRPNQLEGAEAAWAALAKARGIAESGVTPQLQVTNPGMGKGGNRSKADGLGIGGLNGFWLPEYLKFVGFYQAAIPRVVSGEKDRKTYILRPRRLSWERHLSVFSAFRENFFASSSIKMDILALLRYSETFVQQWKEGQAHTSRFAGGGRPSDFVAAMETIFYKYLGSAHATMNLSTLVFPEWTKPIETLKEAEAFIELLHEHATVIYPLKEKEGDMHDLLLAYRRFVSGNDLRAFFQFNRHYGSHVMSELADGNRPKQFTTTNLEVLFMNHPESDKLTPIIQSAGFQRIASAIRASTVMPQHFKAIGKPGPYEIRYGLGNDLMRNATYPKKFVAALGEFVHAYMRENGRVEELYKGNPPISRTLIREDDLQEIIRLIDTYDSETVASLLVAFGYANKPSEKSN